MEAPALHAQHRDDAGNHANKAKRDVDSENGEKDWGIAWHLEPGYDDRVANHNTLRGSLPQGPTYPCASQHYSSVTVAGLSPAVSVVEV
jgi:hypothetical protein